MRFRMVTQAFLFVLLTSMLCSVFVEASQSAWKNSDISLARSHSVDRMVVSTLLGSSSVASNGLSFGVDTRISGDYGGAYPMVATDTVGGVYVTWYNLDTLELFFTYSHDYGKSWASVTKLCGGGNPLVGCSDPDLAVDSQSGYVYVVWMDNRTGHTNVYLCTSVDRGVHFGPAAMVNNVDGSDIASVDSGVSYSTHVTVANNGTVYVAWQDNRTNPSCSDVYLARSSDSGHTFEGNTRVNPYETGANHTGPWVTVDEAGAVYVVYTKTNLTAQSVFMTKSLDGGLSFKAPAKVNDDSLNCYRGKKEVAVSKDGKVYAVWTDGRNGVGQASSWDIYFATSSDGGLSFGSNVRVNDDHGPIPHGTPSLTIDRKGGIHVVWEDFRNRVESSSYFRDIYYAFLNDSQPFSENVRVNYLPNATRVDCADPNIAIDSLGNLYVVWADSPYSDNNYGIYLALPEITPVSPSIIRDVLTWAALSAVLVLVVTAIILNRKRRGRRERQPPSDETHPPSEESLGSSGMRKGYAQNGLPSSESSSPQETNERKYSIFQRLYRLVASPSEAMKDIGFSPDYGGPVLLVILDIILGVAPVLLVLQKIQLTGDSQAVSEVSGWVSPYVLTVVILSILLYFGFWVAKSLLVKFLCDRGSDWSFATAASVTGYAYVADIVFGIIILMLVYPLLPSLTLNLSNVDAMRVWTNFRAQVFQILLIVTVPVGFIGMLWKSYLGGLGAKFGTRERCSVRWGTVAFIVLALLGWLISYILLGTV